MRTRLLLRRGESSLTASLSRQSSYTQCLKASLSCSCHHTIQYQQFRAASSSRSVQNQTQSESVVAPQPIPRDFNPTPFSENDMINGSVAMPTSQSISRRAVIYKAAARLARRNPNITIDDALVERVIKGEPVLFLNEDEKLRVEALATEMARDKAADRSLITGEVEMPEEVRMTDFPDKSMQVLSNWTLRGLDPTKATEEEASPKKSKRGRPKKKGDEAEPAAVESVDAKISKVIQKNGSFDTLKRDRFKEKLKQLM